MPWMECCRMDERTRFIGRILDGERMSDLCQEFKISRKTGYKFLERYKRDGIIGLLDRRRSPDHIPHKTPDKTVGLILKLRKTRSTWGPKKIRAKLLELHPGLKIPAASTIGDILKREGYIETRRRLRRKNYYPSDLTDSLQANDVWSVDFKGQFKMLNHKYCYPLTISDHYSRFLFACEALESTKGAPVFSSFEAVFKQYGMPKIIRSDNGAPFASNGLGGLSFLAVWFIRLGIRPERIEPGHPEQNGRHERIHLTLKREATRPPGHNILHQQEMLDRFQKIYNFERPHEALNQKSPSSQLTKSTRIYPDELPEIDYTTFDEIRTVSACGTIRVPKWDAFCFLGRAFRGQPVGLRQIDAKTWLVNFAGMELGFIVEKGKGFTLEPANPLLAADG